SRSRLFYPMLALLALLILTTVGGGIYIFLQFNSGTSVAAQVKNAQDSMSHANKVISTNPSAALTDLANAQKSLRTLQQNTTLTNNQHTTVSNLEGKLTRSVQMAIANYNIQSSNTLLCPFNATTNAINDGTTGPQAKTIVQVKGKRATQVYAQVMDNKLYHDKQNS